jgi:hypothetical protein
MDLHEQVLGVLKKVLSTLNVRDRTASLKKDLVAKCLVFMIYFLVKNETNQDEFRRRKGFKLIIKSLLTIDNPYIQKLTLIMIYELYRENYQLLLEYEREHSRTLRNLNKSFDTYFKKNNKDFCVYYFQLLVFFFKIEKQAFFQNQSWITREIEIDRVDLVGTLTACYREITKLDFRSLVNSNEKTITVPPEVAVLTAGLSFLGQLSENSTMAVGNYVKSFFTIQQVTEALTQLHSWYFLKMEFLNYLSNSYLHSKKLEVSEYNAIRELVRDHCVKFMAEYRVGKNYRHKTWVSSHQEGCYICIYTV